MTSLSKTFLDLIKVSLGNKEILEVEPSDQEWYHLYVMSQQQALCGLLFEGFVKCNENRKEKTRSVFFEWYGTQLQIEGRNKLQNQRSKELYELFKEAGFRSCVLKGQGTALYYAKPGIRQCGDIDIWLTKDGKSKTDDVRSEILDLAHKKKWKIGHIDIKHSDMEIFEDVPVEVHFLPSWMYCPSTNKRLMRYFADAAERQFENYDERVGFSHTIIDFDLVYSMVHIYRHIFSEGIGLRQLVDYYFILLHSTSEQRIEALKVLRGLRMSSFAGGIMWILHENFGMKEEYLLCPLNERHGRFLLSEIMTAGNFGHYDSRRHERGSLGKFRYGFIQFKKNLRFVMYYPSEVLWSPFWKLWHYGWRKRKGYL